MKKKYVICKIEKNSYRDAWFLHLLNRGEFKTLQDFMSNIVKLGCEKFKEDCPEPTFRIITTGKQKEKE